MLVLPQGDELGRTRGGKLEHPGGTIGLLDLEEAGSQPAEQKPTGDGFLAVLVQLGELDDRAQRVNVDQAVQVAIDRMVELVAMPPAQRARNRVAGAAVTAPPAKRERTGKLEVELDVRIGAGDDVDRVADEMTALQASSVLLEHDRSPVSIVSRTCQVGSLLAVTGPDLGTALAIGSVAFPLQSLEESLDD